MKMMLLNRHQAFETQYRKEVKHMKKAFVLMISMLFLAGFSSVMAFHDEGVADCAGCHTMHNSQDGALVDADSPTGNAYLLKDATPSDTCLVCHASYGQMSTDGQTRGPGGDFYWITQTISWSAHGHDYYVYGREHGHNLDSPGYGLSEDLQLTSAPGGTYDSTHMGCNSCHDPHGNENFRLLYGIGETAENYPLGYTFTYAAPNADGNSRRTNIGDSGEELHGQHTAYISGMGNWCANCHEGFHADYTTNFVHPVDEEIDTDLSNIYNAYVTTGDMTGGYGTAYLPLVPFEDAANTTSSTTGTTANSVVMCLTCHRAHASPYPDAGRWDFGATFLNEGHPDPLTEPYVSYYLGDNPLNTDNQRSLCNKCHAQDADDHLPVPPGP
jgi:hypothetical protein